MASSEICDSDVLIVGAGPAGCAAGVLLAARGLRVEIVERRIAGHHKICGDLLGPRTLHLLQALDLGWSREPAQGFPIEGICVYDDDRLKSAALFRSNTPEPGWGLTLRRDILDAHLQERALASGCRISFGIRFERIQERKEGAVLSRAVAVAGGAARIYRSKVVLGADGADSAAARSSGLLNRDPKSRILAIRGYFSQVRGLRNGVELYFTRRLLPGYAWVIPLGEDLANVGLGVRQDACVQNGLRLQQELVRFVREHPSLSARMRNARLVGRVQGAAIGGYGREARRSGPNLLLLGDAASLADPISGEGVFGALRSARMAAGTVAEAFRADTFSAEFLARFDAGCRKYFDAAYRYTNFLAGLPGVRGFGRPLALWGLKRVEKNCVVDVQYARMVAGFFTGMLPRGRMLSGHWLRKTLIG
ncbi:MAG: NAD(P)/FAD-dependent oxidoreductase [bacterium]